MAGLHGNIIFEHLPRLVNLDYVKQGGESCRVPSAAAVFIFERLDVDL